MGGLDGAVNDIIAEVLTSLALCKVYLCRGLLLKTIIILLQSFIVMELTASECLSIIWVINSGPSCPLVGDGRGVHR
jgi:hypothetical protein